MAREIVMPKLGLTMSEGTITKLHISEGDSVSKGDKIMSIETDKLTNDVEADVDGVVRLVLYKEWDVVPVKAVIAVIADEDEDISKYKSLKKSEDTGEQVTEVKQEVVSEKANVSENTEVLATPYAKHLAKEKGVSLNSVTATGYNGVIVARDIESAKPSHKMTGAARNAAVIHGVDVSEIDKKSRIRKSDVLEKISSTDLKEEIDIVNASSMRRAIAGNMIKYWNSTPMVTFDIDVVMDSVIEMRDKLNKEYSDDGVKISYNHIIMKVLSKLLLKHKSLNAYFDGEKIEYHNYVNVGIAVALEDGLVVPNVKNANKLDLYEIALLTEELIKKARTNSLELNEMNGGTFTITNLGVYGLRSFSPIVNKPESAILGINAIRDELKLEGDKVVVKKVCTFSLTADHSMVDGRDAGAFLQDFKKYLENPFLMI